MLNNIGFACLVTALAVSLYGMITPGLGTRLNNWNLVRSAQWATLLNLLFITLASAALLRALAQDDFSVRFVWENSSADMPLGYKITAFWGGMNGSLLFWEWVLAGFSAFVVFAYQRHHREIIPHVIQVLNLIQVFLLILLVSWSNPLAIQVPIPETGRGLNPLLQHPAMAFHPPLLYLGYIGFSVPFAFAIASLIRGKLDNAWVVSTRRWTLFAWYALLTGQMLGGQWAYEELGWGGYWGWDPVENAALIPWLTSTAFLHSVILQEKRNMMKVWNMSLIILTFSLSILGTFIVRSGVLNSVHAFAQSEVGPAFLVFIALVLPASFFLMFRRIHLLESRHTSEVLLSKESTFLLNNLLLIGIAFTVFLGTVFPLVAEAVRGTKLSIQAPFFNTITTPLGVALVGLIGLCTLIAWRHSSPGPFLRNLRLPLGFAVAAVLGVVASGLRHPGAALVFAICAFSAAAIVNDYLRTVRIRGGQLGLSWGAALLSTARRNLQRFGGLWIHLGVILLFVGFTGNLLSQESSFTLAPHQPVQVGAYRLLFTEMRSEPQRNVTLRMAVVEVYRDGEQLTTLTPARSFYTTQPEPLSEVAIYRTLAEDLYLVLTNENQDGSITLRARINPLVAWTWLAFPLITLGTFTALCYRPRRLEAGV